MDLDDAAPQLDALKRSLRILFGSKCYFISRLFLTNKLFAAQPCVVCLHGH